MKKITLLISLSILFGICASCAQDNIKENTEEDYQEAYQDNVENLVELNDTESIVIDEDKSQVILYYKDAKGYLVPVMRQIHKQESVARNVIQALVNTDENRIDLRNIGLSPVLPEGIEFELALKEDNLMRLSFNDAIESFSTEEEEQRAIQAVVYTLTEFMTVDKVQILVNNQIIENLTHGTDVGEPITRGNINPINNVVDSEFVKSTLYSYNNATDSYTYYIPVTKNIRSENKDIKNIVLEELTLLKEMNVAYPEDLEIEEVIEEEADITIKLGGNVDGTEEELNRLIKGICLAIGQNSTAENVKVLIGEEIISKDIPTFANVY